MDETIIKNINDNVKWNDTLYFGGDWSFGGLENVAKYRNRIHCQTIHFVIGNHDHHLLKPEIAALFTSVQHVIGYPDGKKIGGTRFLICHFPWLVWDKHAKGSIHLHGHSHGSLKDKEYYKRKVLDIGIDAHPEFRPFHIDEIMKIMDKREVNIIDHHGEDHD